MEQLPDPSAVAIVAVSLSHPWSSIASRLQQRFELVGCALLPAGTSKALASSAPDAMWLMTARPRRPRSICIGEQSGGRVCVVVWHMHTARGWRGHEVDRLGERRADGGVHHPKLTLALARVE